MVGQGGLTDHGRILMTMLDAVYVDTVEERRIKSLLDVSGQAHRPAYGVALIPLGGNTPLNPRGFAAVFSVALRRNSPRRDSSATH